MRNVTIFTDGSCLGNPGRGGWGCILRCEGHEKELSGGYAHTTNNRMEIMAAIAGLEELKEPCAVTLYTDSQYLRHAVEKKWLAGWRKNGWKTAAKKPVKNRDLWERLQVQLDRHSVTLEWVRGHNGHAENERCDELARSQSARHDLPEDTGYEPEYNVLTLKEASLQKGFTLALLVRRLFHFQGDVSNACCISSPLRKRRHTISLPIECP